jgi:hypothetical protein
MLNAQKSEDTTTSSRRKTPSPIVSPAYKKLMEIDKQVASSLKNLVGNESAQQAFSSEIIAAGVLMLRIFDDHPDEWNEFKSADPLSADIHCKGEGFAFREVATVLWRKHRADAPTRERISQYGKAIAAAHRAFLDKNAEDLLASIKSLGGIKGILTLAKTEKGTEKKYLRILIPHVRTHYCVDPDGSYEITSTEDKK